MIAALGLVATSAAGAQQTARDAAGQTPRGTAVMAGTIASNQDARPVRGARVTLNSASGSLPGRTATTDEAGRFVFLDLPVGRYDLQASKAGFVTTNFGARRPGGDGTPVSIADGQQITGLTISMPRGSAVSGIVLDESGRPLPGVFVNLMRFGYSPTTGERTLGNATSSSGTETDDRGTWRIWGLPPGEYLVIARVRGYAPSEWAPGQAVRRLSAADVDRAIAFARSGRGVAPGGPAPTEDALARSGDPVQYAPVFHPGTNDLSQAATITLGTGEERTGIDIAFRRAPAARVHGAVRLLEGMTMADVRLSIVAGGDNAGLWESIGVRELTIPLQADGSFTFGGIAPGRYLIEARASDAGRARPDGSPARSAWARTEVAIDGRDEELTVEMRPGMTVAGRVAFNGATPPPKDTSGVRIFLRPPGAGANLSAGPPGGTADAEGRFSFTDVRPTTYRLTWMRPPSFEGWALRSVVANGRDALDFGLTVRPGQDVTLVATFTDRPAELSGTLQSASGVPAPDHYIIVFAADRSFWMPGARRVSMLRPGTDGRYVWPNIAPGEYFVAALTDVEPGAWHSRTFLEELVPAAIRVTVGEGERRVQNIQIR
jgi:hypothetical protein